MIMTVLKYNKHNNKHNNKRNNNNNKGINKMDCTFSISILQKQFWGLSLNACFRVCMVEYFCSLAAFLLRTTETFHLFPARTRPRGPHRYGKGYPRASQRKSNQTSTAVVAVLYK